MLVLQHLRQLDIQKALCQHTSNSYHTCTLLAKTTILISPIISNQSFDSSPLQMQNRKLELHCVEGDHDGMIPEKLDEKICAARCKPRVLYIVPSGGNPTGATLTLERKKQIYRVGNLKQTLGRGWQEGYRIMIASHGVHPPPFNVWMHNQDKYVQNWSIIL